MFDPEVRNMLSVIAERLRMIAITNLATEIYRSQTEMDSFHGRDGDRSEYCENKMEAAISMAKRIYKNNM